MKFCLLLLLSALLVLNGSHLFYFNFFTHSLPWGIYQRVKGVPYKGELAATCLSTEVADYGISRSYLARGTCSTGAVLVLKKIAGMPGEQYSQKDGILHLNGHDYPIIKQDSLGRPLKVFYSQGILGKDEYFLLSDFATNSWDSRYWGPMHIQFLLKPFCLFENPKR